MSAPTRKEFLAEYITPATVSPQDSPCPICYEDYDDTTTTTTTSHTAVTFSSPTSCNHIFGRECIVHWLDTQTVNTCPCCRCELFVVPAAAAAYADSGYGSGEDSENESEYEDWDYDLDDDEGYEEGDGEDEDWEDEDDDDDNTHIIHILQPTIKFPIRILLTLLQTTWYKIWHLMYIVITNIEHTHKTSAIARLALLAHNRYLPSTFVLLGFFLMTLTALLGDDVAGLLDERRVRVLEGLLGDMMEYQKGLVGALWIGAGTGMGTEMGIGTRPCVGDAVPRFPMHDRVLIDSWFYRMKEGMGTLPVATGRQRRAAEEQDL